MFHNACLVVYAWSAVFGHTHTHTHFCNVCGACRHYPGHDGDVDDEEHADDADDEDEDSDDDILRAETSPITRNTPSFPE